MTGVLSYAAFVDVGVRKDGMLHSSEIRWLVGGHVHDMREWVAVGDRLPLLYVLEVDQQRERFTLATRPPPDLVHAGSVRECNDATRGLVGFGRCRSACKTAPSGSMQVSAPGGLAAMAEKQRVSQVGHEEPFPSLQPSSAVPPTVYTMGEGGRAAGEEATEVRPTVCAILMGVEEMPHSSPAPLPMEVARVTIRGGVRILFAMPWKS